MRPTRRSSRLPGFRYGGGHAYLLTICTADRMPLLGEVHQNAVVLSPIGCLVQACWEMIPTHHAGVDLDTIAILPDHVHGILAINDSSPARLGAVVGGFKSAVSREARRNAAWTSAPLWQRGYHDRIIRDGSHLDRVRRYVIENPLRLTLRRVRG